MSDELLKESIEVGPYLFELDEEGVTITDRGTDDDAAGADEDEPAVDLTPQTRRDANQLSMALRKASKRLEEIARNLPAEVSARG